MSHEYCDKCFELISNTIHLCNTNNITKCNQCESLRKENEKLRKQLEIAKEALKYKSRVTYGTELCNTEEENNEILARHFFHNQSKTRQALEQIEKLEQLLSSEGEK